MTLMIITLTVLLLATATAQDDATIPRQAPSPVGEIYIARSLRESRTSPSAFCSALRNLPSPYVSGHLTTRTSSRGDSIRRIAGARQCCSCPTCQRP
jgi:hypothetical protein